MFWMPDYLGEIQGDLSNAGCFVALCFSVLWWWRSLPADVLLTECCSGGAFSIIPARCFFSYADLDGIARGPILFGDQDAHAVKSAL